MGFELSRWNVHRRKREQTEGLDLRLPLHLGVPQHDRRHHNQSQVCQNRRYRSNMADDDECAHCRTRAFTTDNQHRSPDCADRLAVEQGSKEGDEEGCPGYGEQDPDGVDKRFSCRRNTLDGDADRGLHQCQPDNVCQDPNDVVLHGFRPLPSVEVFFQSP